MSFSFGRGALGLQAGTSGRRLSAGVLSDAEGKLITLGDLLSTKVKKNVLSGSDLSQDQVPAIGTSKSRLLQRAGFPVHATHPEPKRISSRRNLYPFSFPLSSVKIEIRRREVYKIK